MVVLIEDEDRGGVVIFDAFCFVEIVIDAVEVYLGMIDSAILGEFLVLSSEFFAAVAVS